MIAAALGIGKKVFGRSGVQAFRRSGIRHSAFGRSTFGKRRRGFVLLEVIVSLVIMGIAVAALMRSFTISMTAIRKNDVMAQACVLAETLMQSVEARPPEEATTRGSFTKSDARYGEIAADDRFAKYSYELVYTDEAVKYPHRQSGTHYENLRDLHAARLTVTYFDEARMREPMTALVIHTLIPPVEHFTQRSKLENELFLEDESARGRR